MKKYLRKISLYTAKKLYKENEEIVISDLHLECIYLDSAELRSKQTKGSIYLLLKQDNSSTWNKTLLTKEIEKLNIGINLINFYKIEDSSLR